jgi:hypothetical protein
VPGPEKAYDCVLLPTPEELSMKDERFASTERESVG